MNQEQGSLITLINPPIKKDASKSGINLKKIIQQSPVTILPMFLAGSFSHENEAFFAGLEVFFFFMGFA